MTSLFRRLWSDPAVKALLICIVAIAVGFLVPPSLPLIGILFLICGAIGFFRTVGPNRPFWGIIAIAGLIIVSLIGLILLFGLSVS